MKKHTNSILKTARFVSIALCLIASFGAILLTSCQEETKPVKIEKDWKSYFEDGKYLDYQEKYDQSITNYREALNRLKGVEYEKEWRADLLAHLARLLVLQGKLDEAAPLTEEAMALAGDPKAQGPNHGEVLVSLDDLAETYNMVGSRKRSDKVKCFEMAYRILNGHFAGRNKKKNLTRSVKQLACAYIMAGEKEKAIPIEAQFLKQNAKDKRPYHGLMILAAAHEGAGDHERAKELFNQAEKSFGKSSAKSLDTGYAILTARALRENNKLEEAQRVLTDFMDEHPHTRSVDLYDELATICDDKGDYELAEDYYNKAIEFSGKSKSKASLKALRTRMRDYARFLRRRGRVDEAVQIENKAVRVRDYKTEAFSDESDAALVEDERNKQERSNSETSLDETSPF